MRWSASVARLTALLWAVSLLAAEPPQAGWGRHRRLYAVPCLAPVTVDGRLDEWDQSGRVSLDGPGRQSARLAVMWDDRALYLGGLVRDTTPFGADDGLTLWLANREPLALRAGDPRAAWRLADDGLGYSFECRLAWTDIGPKPAADASLPGALRLSWGPGQTACDVLGEPGVPETQPDCWGRIIFCGRGRLPHELLGEALRPQRPTPLRVACRIPVDSYVTLQLRGGQGRHQRLLLGAERRDPGTRMEPWDGCDDYGRPLPAGQYRWVGLYHLGVRGEPLDQSPGTAPPAPSDGHWRDPRSPDTGYRLWADGQPVFGRWDRADRPLWWIDGLLPEAGPLAAVTWLAGLREPRGAADGFVAVGTADGQTRLFTDDGIYVASLARAGQLARPSADRPWYLLPTAANGVATVIDGLRRVVKLAGGPLTLAAEEARSARQASGDWQTACARERPWCIARGAAGLATAEPIVRDHDTERGFEARAAQDGQRLLLSVTLRGGDLRDPLELRLGGHRLAVRRSGATLDGQPLEVDLAVSDEAGGCSARLTLGLDRLDPLPPPGRLARADLSYTWDGQRVAWAGSDPAAESPAGWLTCE